MFPIDVLKHVKENLKTLIRINQLLRMRSTLIIFVLMPNYFGYKFAHRIGHVRDRYTIDDLRKLLGKAEFRIVTWKYHTLHLSSILCEF